MIEVDILIENNKLVDLAIDGANKGKSLKVLAEGLDISYSTFKHHLKASGYSHPKGIELHKIRIEYEYNKPMLHVIQELSNQKKGPVDISSLLGIDPKTIKKFCHENNIQLIRQKTAPKNYQNIIKAIKSRVRERKNLVWIGDEDNKMYLSEVARKLGLSPATICKYNKQGLTLDQMMEKAPKKHNKATVRYDNIIIEAGMEFVDLKGTVVTVTKLEEGFVGTDIHYRGSSAMGRLNADVFRDTYPLTTSTQ